MRAGNLRNKAEIQQLGSGQDEFGAVNETEFSKFKDVWCSINPVSGKENFNSNKDFATVTHKIKIRFIPNLNASMQIDYMGRKFKIINIRNFGEMGKELEILAEEQIND